MTPLPPAIFLMGPTAAGKTDLALQLVRHLPCDIISVDSALVYRGMDIGTAKPGPEVLAAAPHRLIDILDPAQAYSAAQFRSDALHEMAQITQAGRIPLLVGGTMLYFRALQRGLSDLPAADGAVRARLEEELQRVGLSGMHARLVQVDPRAGARIHPHDTQRIQRALEVYEVSGTPLSALLEAAEGAVFPYRAVQVIVSPADRAELHRRIETRFHAMLKSGFVAEVEQLRGRGDLHPGLPALRAVGYRQIWSYLEGEMSYEQMVERGIFATRQFAKRQLTWLRSTQDAPGTTARMQEVGQRKEQLPRMPKCGEYRRPPGMEEGTTPWMEAAPAHPALAALVHPWTSKVERRLEQPSRATHGACCRDIPEPPTWFDASPNIFDKVLKHLTDTLI